MNTKRNTTRQTTRRKPQHQESYFDPIKRRLIKFWLPALILIGAMIYVSQWRYTPEREAKYGLDRVNFWRTQAGVGKLEFNSLLALSAKNHAQYLTRKAEGHDENDSGAAGFTGKTAQNRATYVGYPAQIAENLTISNWARSGKSSVDGLMTALYHRLSLLNPQHDEAGASWARERYNAFVINQGSSKYRELCDNRSHAIAANYILTTYCLEQKVNIAINTPPAERLEPVMFPIGNNIDPIYDGREFPNPMPDRKQTGNPVSIAFYGEQSPVKMISFTLTAPDGEITNTRILTAQNDPNRLLGENEFALFSLDKLKFNTTYQVSFKYQQNQQTHTKNWTFKTRAKRHLLEW